MSMGNHRNGVFYFKPALPNLYHSVQKIDNKHIKKTATGSGMINIPVFHRSFNQTVRHRAIKIWFKILKNCSADAHASTNQIFKFYYLCLQKNFKPH